MRNKMKVAPVLQVPENVTEVEFRALLDGWWTYGGYRQISINADNVATPYATYREDLPMYVIEQWYKMPWEKQLKICIESGSPEKWCTRVMSLSIKSNSSPFHSQYRRFSLRMREQFDGSIQQTPLWNGNEATDYSDNVCVKCLKLEIAKLDFYEAMLIDAMGYKGMKPRRFAEDNNLDVVSVTNNYYSIKKRLVKACKEYH